jgi:hypothetical protein
MHMDEHQLKRARMLKTNLCKAYQYNKKCIYPQKECPFAHGKADLRKPGDLLKEIDR